MKNNEVIKDPPMETVHTLRTAESFVIRLLLSRRLRGARMININHLGATPASVWVIKKVISPLQRWIYRVTRGRFLSNMGSGRDMLLLTTKGRRTGKDRTIPVFYLRDGETIVICNVRPKSERGVNPWVINLRSHPFAQLQIGADTAHYHAREANTDEINQLWPRLIALWPAYQVHYKRGGRRIVFILERSSS